MKIFLSSAISLIITLFSMCNLYAQQDTLSRLGVGGSIGWGYLTPKGDHNQEVMKSHNVWYGDLRLMYQSGSNDIYEQKWHHPIVEFGLLYGNFSRIKLQGPETPYVGKVGHEFAVYAGMRFNFWSSGRWSIGGDFQNGIAYFTKRFDEDKNEDNWLVGSPLSIFINIGVYVQYKFAKDWMVSLGADFKHVSNGTLARPNLGANTGGPTLLIAYMPEYKKGNERAASQRIEFQTEKKNDFHSKRGIYLEVSAGIAGSTLTEQFQTYKKNHYTVYGSFISQIAGMYRYSALFASGVEIDYRRANYASRLRYYDEVNGYHYKKYSKNMLGLGFQQEVFYHNVSLQAGVGVYLYRKLGHAGKTNGLSYQTVGLRYSFPFSGNRLFIGYNVKAHNFSKADAMQFHIGYRFF